MNKLELDGLFDENGYLKKDIIGEYTDNNGNIFKYCLEDGVNFYHYLYIYNEKIEKIIENKALIDYNNSYENGIYGKDEYYGDIVIEKDNSIVIMIKDLKKEIEEYDDITDFIIYTIDDCIYLKTEEDEKIQKIKEFIKNDTTQLNRVLVINQNNEYEERYDFNRVNNCFECTDKDVIAVSVSNYDYLRDICDNCECDTMNEQTEETYCSIHKNKIDCAIGDIISSHDYFKEYLEDYKRQQELKKYRSDKND